jgi:tetratricopeptide (TPR) repeat protein
MQLHARLTMYALLSETEADFRSLILAQLGNDLDAGELFHPDMLAKMQDRFKKEHHYEPSSLRDLLSYADMGDVEQILRTHKTRLSSEPAEMLRVIGPRFAQLIPIRNRVMHSRPINFTDLPTVLQFCELLVAKFPSLFPDLTTASQMLRDDPSFVLQQTIPAADSDAACAHNLPFPDFDETGFIGREADLKLLHKHLRGPYPVVSILGEGGLGKTSLALKAAYEILDETQHTFDAIIWSSSKSAQLTPHDIRDIDHAIRDSLGLLKHAATSLTSENLEDPAAEIHAYMREYRVLLILDNLENVLDARIRSFLEGIPQGTKIILTSRIGLQAMDFPITLRPMEESVDLLRAVASARGVEGLTQTSNKQLEIYCKRLHHNPLAIKWFVAAVQYGQRPEEVLQEQGLLLDYCMSNVYKHLTEDCRTVLSIFQTLGKSLGMAHLVAISGLEAAKARAALYQLDRANMITMQSIPMGTSYETTYAINHLALAFLNKHHVVGNADRAMIQKHQRQFIAMVEAVSGEAETDPFSIRTIHATTETQIVVAGMLRNALDAVRGKRIADADFAAADSLLEQAKGIAPDFFEVFRAEGYIRYRAKRVSEAVLAYEAAIELKADHAPLRLWFGQLLLHEGNLSDAKTQLDMASSLMPSEPRIQIEHARLHLYQRDFAQTRNLLTQFITDSALTDTYKRQAHDLLVQSHIREAEEELNANRSPIQALPCFEHARAAYDAVPGELMDIKIKQKVAKGLTTASRIEKNLRVGDLGQRAYAIRKWCEDVQLEVSRAEAEVIERKGQVVGATFEGVISRMEHGYGFIKVIDKRPIRDVFFHRTSIVGRWFEFQVGLRVRFVMERDDEGRYRAVQVTPFKQ